MSAEILLRRVATELTRYTYRFSDEKMLHDGIAAVLRGIGVDFMQELEADARNRFDFFIVGGVVIEAKIGGSFGAACHQCDRYMQLETVEAVALVTSKKWPTVATRLRDKPFAVINVKPLAF